jgi:hypothetical protein
MKTNQPSNDFGDALLDHDVQDAYSFLGIQVERLEIAESRQERNLPVPEWTDQDAYEKVLSGQRASLADIKRYASRGLQFATETLKKIEPQVRDVTCQDGQIHPEIARLEGDVKTLLGVLSGSIASALVVVIPPVAAGAATSIATVLAIIIIKNQVKKFCQQGAASIEQPEAEK